MFHVLTEHTEELVTALFGSDQFLFTRRVAGPRDMTCWLLDCRPRSEPEWRAAETQLIASISVDAWLERFAAGDVARLYLLAPRHGNMTLSACRQVDVQHFPSGTKSLLFKVDEAIVMVADAPPEIGPVQSTRRVWTTARIRNKSGSV